MKGHVFECYVFESYSDKGGIGTEKLFNNEGQAVDFARGEWNNLTTSEKNRLDRFHIYAIDITAKQIDAYESGEADFVLEELWTRDVWDPLKGIGRFKVKGGFERVFTHYGKPVTYITTGDCCDERIGIHNVVDLEGAVELPVLSQEYRLLKREGEYILFFNDENEIFAFSDLPDDLDFHRIAADMHRQACKEEPLKMPTKLYKLYCEATEAVFSARSAEEQGKISCGLIREDEKDTRVREARYIWKKYRYSLEYMEHLARQDDQITKEYKKELIEAYEEIWIDLLGNSNLQRKRNLCGLTQMQLAEAAGVSVSVIRKYENGERELSKARADTLFKICQTLGCTPEEIIER